MTQRSLISAGTLFALPAVAGLLIFVAVPFVLAIALAFTNLHLGSPLPLEFVGLRQFLRLFADPAFIDTYAGEEFAGKNAPEKSLFKTIIENHEPLCGRMKQQQQVFMFGDDGNKIASSVMVPLHGPEWGGILSIGSYDPERFQPGMGIELLANMGEVLSFIIKPWIAEP